MLRTVDAAAPNVTAPMIGLSLTMYLALYALLLATFIFVIFHIARRAGEPASGDKTPGGLFAPHPGVTRS